MALYFQKYKLNIKWTHIHTHTGCFIYAGYLSNTSALRFSRRRFWRKPWSWMLHRVALVRIDISEERNASMIGLTRIFEPGRTSAVISNWSTLPHLVTVHVSSLATWENKWDSSIKQNTTQEYELDKGYLGRTSIMYILLFKLKYILWFRHLNILFIPT
jgi:hypothetical protein